MKQMGPLCGVCEWSNCTRATRARSRWCPRHENKRNRVEYWNIREGSIAARWRKGERVKR